MAATTTTAPNTTTAAASSSSTAAPVKFQPLSSCVDVSFWNLLSQKKLDEFKLSTEPVPIVGTFGMAPHAAGRSKKTAGYSVPARMMLGSSGFDGGGGSADRSGEDEYPVRGTLLNANTVEEFKAFDKRGLIKKEGEALWKEIRDGGCTKDPRRLNRFLLLTYANLKTHRYYYWFAFPALVPQAFTSAGEPSRLADSVHAEAVSAILQQHRRRGRPSHFVALLSKTTGGGREAVQLATLSEHLSQGPQKGGAGAPPRALFGFVDPSTLDGYPGWPLRNYLAYLRYNFPQLESAEILSLRDRPDGAGGGSKKSLIFHVNLTSAGAGAGADEKKTPNTLGWEANAKGRPGARVVDLRAVFDPKTLARTSADLNLKLMRWRSLPSLDIERLKRTRVLLLGAGTLGCYVARALLGWGVRKIDFVDNGKVSYSNPVRQPLYDFKDSVGAKTMKALAAAENLNKICPSVESRGYVLTIPMPGHKVPESQVEQVRKAFETLKELISAHDLIFLLTDSRESRWLPSLLAAAHGKMLVNAALGFDTFVVMRHGIRNSPHTPPAPAPASASAPPAQECKGGRRDLGCYFCNDVVAPTDSLSDRTLDQQCTVTRPGAAPIASALAVEVGISWLQRQHMSSQSAAAESKAGIEKGAADAVGGDSELGAVPHQLRGGLRRFELLTITGHAYSRCTACSDPVLKLYKDRGWMFVSDAMNKPQYLEDVTGLTQMKKEAESMLEDIDWADDEDED